MTATVAGDVLQVLHAPEAVCYLVRYVEGPSRERIVGLFGTDTLPLPWTSSPRGSGSRTNSSRPEPAPKGRGLDAPHRRLPP